MCGGGGGGALSATQGVWGWQGGLGGPVGRGVGSLCVVHIALSLCHVCTLITICFFQHQGVCEWWLKMLRGPTFPYNLEVMGNALDVVWYT